MMGMTMADARDCSYWEYTAVLSTWNERHKSDDDNEPVDAPDFETFQRAQAAIMSDPRLLH